MLCLICHSVCAVLQGKFKHELTLDNLVTGQEFSRPFQRLPAQWFVDVSVGCMRACSAARL